MKTYVTRCSLLELKQLGSEFAGRGFARPLQAHLLSRLLVCFFVSTTGLCNTPPACSFSCPPSCSVAARSQCSASDRQTGLL